MKAGILIWVILGMSQAWGFTLNSTTNPNLQGWSNPEIQLMVNTQNCPAGIDVPALISDAAAIWNGVSTSVVKVSYGGETTSTDFSNPITVYCEVNFQAVLGADQNGVPGAASVRAPSGVIESGLMYLNASSGLANIGRYDQTLLKVIIAHEIGHLLGLGHSDDVNALMYYDGSAKKHLSLSQDDIDGISYLYPSDEMKSAKLAGCGLVKVLSNHNKGFPPRGWSVVLALLMPLAFLFLLWRQAQGRIKVF